MSKGGVWSVILLLTGIVYIAMVLSLEIESPLFVAAFILLAGKELVAAHSGKDRS